MEPTTNWLNDKPPIILGCNITEISFLFVIGGIVCIPISALIGLVAPVIMLLFFYPVGTVAIAALLAAKIRKLKRDRPDRYYLHQVSQIYRGLIGARNSDHVISTSQTWSPRRHDK